MGILLPGESESMELQCEKGKPITYTANRAVNFEIVLTDGSTVKGIIPAGSSIEMVSNGAIKSLNIDIHETSMRPKLVEH